MRENDEPIDLTAEEQAELLASIAGIERGEYITVGTPNYLEVKRNGVHFPQLFESAMIYETTA